jgi:hypothetical protein
MSDTKKILNDAISSLRTDDAAGLKKHVTHALLIKIRKAIKNKKKELSKKLFRKLKV